MVKFIKPYRNERPILLELIGPAGAGKSSLLQALASRDRRLRPGIGLRKLQHMAAVALNTTLLLPVLLSCHSHFDRRGWQDIKKIVRLQTYHYLSQRLDSYRYKALLFDEGPVFLLTWLSAFGGERLQSFRFKKWFQRALEQWSGTLDVIIWLDAPDPILTQRIRSREKQHRVKGGDDIEVAEFLARYRASYELIVSELTARQGPKVIRLNTCQCSLNEMADEIQKRIATGFELVSVPSEAMGANAAGARPGL